jgi:hypothetical protein
MSNKTASILSGFLTFLILIILAISSIFMQMVVLNGVVENQEFNVRCRCPGWRDRRSISDEAG